MGGGSLGEGRLVTFGEFLVREQAVAVLVELAKDLIDMPNLLPRNVQLVRHQVDECILQMTLPHVPLRGAAHASTSTVIVYTKSSLGMHSVSAQGVSVHTTWSPHRRTHDNSDKPTNASVLNKSNAPRQRLLCLFLFFLSET